MLKGFVVACFVCVIGAALLAQPQSVLLTGTAKDCFKGTVYPVPDLAVWAFDSDTNQELTHLLVTMDTATAPDDGEAVMARWEAEYKHLKFLLATSTALAHDTTSSTGAFNLAFPATDSVLVVGHKEREDVAYYYAHTHIGASANGSFVLDMSSGQCGF
jgi:hypothetical protein